MLSGITAQNSQSVLSVQASDGDIFSAQLKALLDDLPVQHIKTGLLLSPDQIRSVLDACEQHSLTLIVDPVLSATSGTRFDTDGLIESYRQLLQVTEVFTPNIPETEQLLNLRIESDGDIEKAAQAFRELGARTVLIKGGHRDSGDFVYDYFDNGEQHFWLQQKKQHSSNTRGTGCALASAIASFMAQGKAAVDAAVLASAYLQQGIETGFAIGTGNGLLGNQGWPMGYKHFPKVAPNRAAFDRQAFTPCGTNALGLYPIVDSLDWLKRLLDLGVKTLQLRVKNTAGSELEALIADAVALGKQYHARLFINDHWQLAIKHQAYGVHLGQEDMDDASLADIQRSGLRLGLSSHSEYEWMRAASVQPSYIAMGAVFPTGTKTVETIGLDNLTQWAAVLNPHFPLVAIGGITTENIKQVTATGVGSCAVISTITGSDDYQSVTKKLLSDF